MTRSAGASAPFLLLFLALALAYPGAGSVSGAAPPPQEGPTVAPFEDYRTSVGRFDGGVLRVTLDAVEVGWKPWGEEGPTVPVNAFAADGAAPRVPGPLIRVAAGTPVRVTLRSSLRLPLVVRGLRSRRGGAPGPAPIWAPFLGDSVAVAPGGTAEVEFTPAVPGTYFYYGRVLRGSDEVVPAPLFSGDREDGPFVGVLIVDPPNGPPPPGERIFLMTQWMDREIRDSWDPSLRMMINGRSWPNTERHRYTEGDSVRWRVLNATGIEHPMHLHGFFFRVDARGDQWGERALAPADRPMAVTETVRPGGTVRLTWVPEEPGNWIFHCHLMRHMSGVQGPPSGAGDGGHETSVHPDDPMAGLVVGITIDAAEDGEARPSAPRRRLRLYTGARPGVFGGAPAYGFVLQKGASPPAADSVEIPGSPIVLVRGEPTEIVVHNRLDFPLGVHWHGLELESWADGVPNWSGTPGAVRPPIAPGDSFVVRMTPPRAGSFMYHVHSEPGHQLSQGLYGPFLVVEPGDSWDPETDRVFVLGSLGAVTNAPAAVNGELQPGPMELRAGTSYRFRFMHISPDDEKRVELIRGGESVTWRAVAKDGAELPPSQVRTVPADLEIRVGETFDFLWTPEKAGDLTLRVHTKFDVGPPAFRFGGPPPHTLSVPVRVH